MTSIADSAVLVTGANRGIGSALVEEALARGAKRVYAGTRQPWSHADERVTPLTLDGPARSRSGRRPARSAPSTSWSITPASRSTTT